MAPCLNDICLTKQDEYSIKKRQSDDWMHISENALHDNFGCVEFNRYHGLTWCIHQCIVCSNKLEIAYKNIYSANIYIMHTIMNIKHSKNNKIMRT